MSLSQLEALLAPLSSGDPCGVDLEYADPAFADLDRTATGKPEQQIGNTIVPAEDPDWKAVEKKALDLLGRTKDIRVTVHLTKSLLRLTGWVGFASGLELLRRLLESYWEGVHPRLDPTDDNDPTMRVNILSSLTDGPTLTAVRTTPIVVSRAMGRFSLKDLESAQEGGGGDSNGAATLAAIDGAAMDADLETLQQTAAAAITCAAELAAIEAAVAQHVDATSAPTFGRLIALSRKAGAFLTEKVAQRAPSVVDAGAFNGAGGVPAAGGVSAGSFGGQINSRDDVVKALDRIIGYYTRHEPSSPIPMFVERCKKMVTMSFIDIVKELVPDALSQVEVLKGRSDE